VRPAAQPTVVRRTGENRHDVVPREGARRPKARFTHLQGQYLAFIETYTTFRGVPPAEADMQRFFRVTPPAVHRMILALEQRGLLRRVAGQTRSIRLCLPSAGIPRLEPRERNGAF
jgi:hypothetical protein